MSRLGKLFKKRWQLFVPPIVIYAAGTAWRKIHSGSRNKRIQFRYGEFLVGCHASHHLPTILASFPDFGRNLADIVLALDVKEPSVIDVGANIGDTALLLARFAPGARVLCIEGDSGFMSDLRSNTAQIDKVTIANAVLSDRTSRVRGTFTQNKGTAHIKLSDTDEILEMQTLDDLLRTCPQFSCPDVIKVDTDGFDPMVLRGARGVLMSARPVVFYEWDPYSYRLAGENDFSHAEFLIDCDYDQFIVFTNKGSLLLQVRQPGREVWESLGNFSRQRRSLEDWHYDIAAFPRERRGVYERLLENHSHASLGR